MSEFSSATELSGEELKKVAEWRWKAVEAFLALDVSPLASRLGVKLIAMMNAKTRQCYPSEVRLAAELRCSIRAIQKAKVELKAKKVLDWETPVGRRGGSYYCFNFEELDQYLEVAKVIGDSAVEQQTTENKASSYMPRRRIMACTVDQKPASTPKNKPSQHEPQFGLNQVQHEPQFGLRPPVSVSNTNNGAFQHEQIDTPTRTTVHSNTNPSSHDIPHYITQSTLLSYHDLRGAAVATQRDANDGEQLSSKPAIQKYEKPHFPFPRLLREFGTNEHIAEQIRLLEFFYVDEADRTFAKQGRETSARYLRSKGVPVTVETLQ